MARGIVTTLFKSQSGWPGGNMQPGVAGAETWDSPQQSSSEQGAEWAASVVIPVHNEEHAIPRLLTAMLEQDLACLQLEIAVVVNGSTDGTAAAARSFIDRFASAHHRLVVVDLPQASKAAALNEGDRHMSSFPRLYLDADIQLSPTAIRRSVEVLGSSDAPMLAAPRVELAESSSPVVHRYGRTWAQLPYVRSHVPGIGFYAVNEAGRRRWWRFPTRMGADDKFVRLHFRQDEAVVIDDVTFTVYLPERLGELLRVRGRWTALNQEIARSCPGLHGRDGSRWRSSARHVLTTPATWPDVPTFLAVWTGAWVFSVRRTLGFGSEWASAASSPMRAPLQTYDHEALDEPAVVARVGVEPTPRRSVHVVIVTYNSGDTAPRCIASLMASENIDEMRITVVDNASADGGAARLAAMFPEIEVINNEENVGFAAAVNQAFEPARGRWFVVVNPDVEVQPETIAECLTYLEKHPAAGCCGVPSVHADGTVNDRSFFMKPSLWSEITLLFALHRLAPASHLWNREQRLAHLPHTSSFEVDAVGGCFTVLDSELFEHLRGYDEDYFLCGEDFDLGLRAIEAGAAPAVVATSPIIHHSEGSFASSADARIAYLRGRAQYQRRWWPAWRASVAGGIRAVSILARLAILGMRRSPRTAELARVWEHRSEWLRPRFT